MQYNFENVRGRDEQKINGKNYFYGGKEENVIREGFIDEFYCICNIYFQ